MTCRARTTAAVFLALTAAAAVSACSFLSEGAVCSVSETEAGSVLRAKTGDMIVVTLDMPEEKGRVWTELNEAFNVKVLARKGCVFLVPNEAGSPPNSRRAQRFVYRVIGPGLSGISLTERSLSDASAPDGRRLDYLVEASGEPEEAAGDPIPPPPGPENKFEVDSKGEVHPIKGVFD